MKKFYSLALAAFFAASSVSAAGLNFRHLSLGESKAAVKAQTQSMGNIAIPQADMSIKSVEPKADIDPTDLSGNYIWSYRSFVGNSTGNTLTLSASLEKVSNSIYTLKYGDFEITATFSMLKQTLSIAANQDLGFNEDNNIEVYFYNFDPESGEAINTPATATIEGDKLVFDESVLLGIGNAELGFFMLGDQNVMTKSDAVVWDNILMPADGWVSCGTGEFADAWQVVAYGGQAYVDEYTWTVNIEKNENEPGLYRIVNPYQYSPISSFNTDPTGEGYILFSIADPDFVMVYPLTYSGLRDEYGTYLNWNPEGLHAIDPQKYTKEYIIENFKITPSTFDAANAKVTFRNCFFGTVDEPSGLYNWQDKNGNALIGTGWLQFKDETFGGINEIANDAIDANAPVEYYNLQGMRILNVENNPGLYIRKQGNTTSKVYMK